MSGKIFKACFAAFIVGNVVGQFNPGFEISTVAPPEGWAQISAAGTSPPNWAVGVDSPRSGARHLRSFTTNTNDNGELGHTSYTVVIPSSGTNYVHVIAYVRRNWSPSSSSNANLILRARSSDGGTLVSSTTQNPGSAYSQFTVSGLASNGKTYYPSMFYAQTTSNSSDLIFRADDFIIYTSTSAAVDLSAPNSPSSLCVNSSGNDNVLTWNDGTDIATNTSGIDGVLILRAPAGTALPTLLDQAYYSSNSAIGPSTIGSWSVLTNGTSSGTYTDAGAAGAPYIYAVYMRDKAFNYSSSPATFTTANAGNDQNLCNPSGVTLAATASAGGIWSVTSGGGSITNLTSATSGVTSIPIGVNTYKWTVTNAGCSTYDFVSISTALFSPSLPVISSPSNASTIAPSNVNLFWTNGGGATSYVVVTGTSNPPATSSSSQTSTNYSMGTLSPSTTYYWRVNATNVCGTTSGTVWSFTTLPEFSAAATGTEGTCGTGWDSGNTWTGFVKDITVSSVPTPLGNGSNQYVLNEVEVELGSDACEKDLSTYFFRLTAPNGTTSIDFFPTSGLTTSNNNKWIRVKFRDHAALEMINEYSTLIQNEYFPFSIGYYAIETDNGFQTTFNGLNPNGTWKFAIKENTTDEIAFVKVTLRFGPKIIIQDLTTVNNNDCGNAQCFDSRSAFIGTNNGFSGNDPVWASPNNVSNTLDGCSWNGSNNNSSWFYFTASQTTAKITLSGLRPTVSDDYSIQPLVFTWPGSCSAPSDIPTGGCPNDNAINNAIYETSGARGAGNAYVNGITANTEFNLSGLTPGTRYGLYVDGNGGNASSFYIDGFSGMQTCDNVILPLPIELLSFDAQLENKATHLTWQTASERNNAYFSIERSSNGIDWKVLETIEGAGSSNELLSYETFDLNPLRGISYYRLKQTDFDGKTSYSEIRTISNTSELMVLPNPGSGMFYISGLSDRQESVIVVRDITGKEITKMTAQKEMQQLDLSQQPSGVYFVTINAEETIRVIKVTE